MKHIAQELRRNQSDAERLLWARLRARRFCGLKFRRQQVLGPYIVDFACLEPKLVIELDGGQHSGQARRDARRTEYLEALGYRVIRFWNDEVLLKMDTVLEEIRRVLIGIPSPYPLPEGEGKEAGGFAGGGGRPDGSFTGGRHNRGAPEERGRREAESTDVAQGRDSFTDGITGEGL